MINGEIWTSECCNELAGLYVLEPDLSHVTRRWIPHLTEVPQPSDIKPGLKPSVGRNEVLTAWTILTQDTPS